MSLLRCMEMRIACAMSQLRSVCSSENTSHLTDNFSDSKPVHKNDSSLPNAPFRKLTRVPSIVTFPPVTKILHVIVLLRTSRKSRQLLLHDVYGTSIQKPAFHCAGEISERIQFFLSRDGLGNPQSRSGRYREDNSCSCRKPNIVSLVV
jgi:hypothetical protein